MASKAHLMRILLYAAAVSSCLLFLYALYHFTQKASYAKKVSFTQRATLTRAQIDEVESDATSIEQSNNLSNHIHPDIDSGILSEDIPPAFADEEHHHGIYRVVLD